MVCEDRIDGGMIGFRRGGGESQRDLAETECEQPVAAPGLAIIVALGNGPRDDLDLAVVEPEAAIGRGDLRLEGAIVRQEDPRRAAFNDSRRNIRSFDVGERLGGEDDAGILLAQRLQPFAQLIAESGIAECEPAFIDDNHRWPPVEPRLDPVKQIGEHGRRCGRSDQAFGLEGLHVCRAQGLVFGIEQPPERTAKAERRQGAFEIIRLQQDREPCQGALFHRGRGK